MHTSLTGLTSGNWNSLCLFQLRVVMLSGYSPHGGVWGNAQHSVVVVVNGLVLAPCSHEVTSIYTHACTHTLSLLLLTEECTNRPVIVKQTHALSCPGPCFKTGPQVNVYTICMNQLLLEVGICDITSFLIISFQKLSSKSIQNNKVSNIQWGNTDCWTCIVQSSNMLTL